MPSEAPWPVRAGSAAVPLVLAAFIAGTATAPARANGAGPLTELAATLAERLQIAEPVAAYKWNANTAIDDPARVDQELSALRTEAAAAHIDPDYVGRVFSDQIRATLAIEYQRFADWKLDPAGVPPAPVDLSVSRAAIDAMNTKILSHITLNWGLLNSPACAGLLQDATGEAIRSHRFDDLYRRAVTVATASYCRAQPTA